MRDMSAGYHSEELRAIAGVIETAPFGIADDIQGVLAQQVDRPEWKFLRNEKVWMSNNTQQAAVVGNQSGLAIINRETRTLVVVTGFQNTNTAAASSKQFRVGRLPNPDFEVGVNSEIPITGMIDVRFLRSGPPTIAFGNAAARIAPVDFSAAELTALNTLTYGFIGTLAGQVSDIWPPHPFGPIAVLHPNSFLIVLNGTTNAQIDGVFYGYEKPLAQGVRA